MTITPLLFVSWLGVSHIFLLVVSSWELTTIYIMAVMDWRHKQDNSEAGVTLLVNPPFFAGSYRHDLQTRTPHSCGCASTKQSGWISDVYQSGTFATMLYTLWWTYKKQWKITMLLMGKSTIFMTIFNCYVSSPEGTCCFISYYRHCSQFNPQVVGRNCLS